MKFEQKVYVTGGEKVVDLLIGLIAPVAANFLLLALIEIVFGLLGLNSYDRGRSSTARIVLELLFYGPFVLVNLAGLAAAALTRRWILWGGLVTAGLGGLAYLISLVS